MPGDARKACFKEDVLRDLFLALDSDGNGYLSYQELWNGLNGDDVRWDDASNADKRAVLDRLWLEADKDGSDQVTFAEFWQLIAASRSPTEDEMARAYDYFLRLDKSGDGYLDRLEIQEGLANPDIDWTLLGFDEGVKERHLFQHADSSGDGRVSFDEFWQMILTNISNRERARAAAAAQMVSVRDVAAWEPSDVGAWLDRVGYGAYRPAFEANGIHGYRLLALTFDALPRLSVRQFDHCRGIMNAIRTLRGIEPEILETTEDCYAKREFARAKPVGLARRLRFGDEGAFAREEKRLNDAYSRPAMIMTEIV